MKIEIRIVDKEKGIVQITGADERWYSKALKPEKDITSIEDYMFVPSVTWVCGHYPKGIAFYKWLADRSWNEAEALKNAAGNKGSKVHQAIGMYLTGSEIKMNDSFVNDAGNPEELTVEEYDCIVSFTEWYKTLNNPKMLASEITVFNDIEGYAGTVDLLIEIDGETWLIDFKTSQQVWPEYELQVSAYKHANLPTNSNIKLGILQIGYRRNKNKYKFTEIEDKYPLFLAAKSIWANETAAEKPKWQTYPLSVKLGEVSKTIKEELIK